MSNLDRSYLKKSEGLNYIRSVKERTKPFFDRTLSVDRPLFESLRIFAVYQQELSNARSQKSYRKKRQKLPQASRRHKKLFISVHLEEVCGVCRLLISTSLNLSSR